MSTHMQNSSYPDDDISQVFTFDDDPEFKETADFFNNLNMADINPMEAYIPSAFLEAAIEAPTLLGDLNGSHLQIDDAKSSQHIPVFRPSSSTMSDFPVEGAVDTPDVQSTLTASVEPRISLNSNNTPKNIVRSGPSNPPTLDAHRDVSDSLQDPPGFPPATSSSLMSSSSPLSPSSSRISLQHLRQMRNNDLNNNNNKITTSAPPLDAGAGVGTGESVGAPSRVRARTRATANITATAPATATTDAISITAANAATAPVPLPSTPAAATVATATFALADAAAGAGAGAGCQEARERGSEEEEWREGEWQRQGRGDDSQTVVQHPVGSVEEGGSDIDLDDDYDDYDEYGGGGVAVREEEGEVHVHEDEVDIYSGSEDGSGAGEQEDGLEDGYWGDGRGEEVGAEDEEGNDGYEYPYGMIIAQNPEHFLPNRNHHENFLPEYNFPDSEYGYLHDNDPYLSHHAHPLHPPPPPAPSPYVHTNVSGNMGTLPSEITDSAGSAFSGILPGMKSQRNFPYQHTPSPAAPYPYHDQFSVNPEKLGSVNSQRRSRSRGRGMGSNRSRSQVRHGMRGGVRGGHRDGVRRDGIECGDVLIYRAVASIRYPDNAHIIHVDTPSSSSSSSSIASSFELDFLQRCLARGSPTTDVATSVATGASDARDHDGNGVGAANGDDGNADDDEEDINKVEARARARSIATGTRALSLLSSAVDTDACARLWGMLWHPARPLRVRIPTSVVMCGGRLQGVMGMGHGTSLGPGTDSNGHKGVSARTDMNGKNSVFPEGVITRKTPSREFLLKEFFRTKFPDQYTGVLECGDNRVILCDDTFVCDIINAIDHKEQECRHTRHVHGKGSGGCQEDGGVCRSNTAIDTESSPPSVASLPPPHPATSTSTPTSATTSATTSAGPYRVLRTHIPPYLGVVYTVSYIDTAYYNTLQHSTGHYNARHDSNAHGNTTPNNIADNAYSDVVCDDDGVRIADGGIAEGDVEAEGGACGERGETRNATKERIQRNMTVPVQSLMCREIRLRRRAAFNRTFMFQNNDKEPKMVNMYRFGDSGDGKKNENSEKGFSLESYSGSGILYYCPERDFSQSSRATTAQTSAPLSPSVSTGHALVYHNGCVIVPSGAQISGNSNHAITTTAAAYSAHVCVPPHDRESIDGVMGMWRRKEREKRSSIRNVNGDFPDVELSTGATSPFPPTSSSSSPYFPDSSILVSDAIHRECARMLSATVEYLTKTYGIHIALLSAEMVEVEGGAVMMTRFVDVEVSGRWAEEREKERMREREILSRKRAARVAAGNDHSGNSAHTRRNLGNSQGHAESGLRPRSVGASGINGVAGSGSAAIGGGGGPPSTSASASSASSTLPASSHAHTHTSSQHALPSGALARKFGILGRPERALFPSGIDPNDIGEVAVMASVWRDRALRNRQELHREIAKKSKLTKEWRGKWEKWTHEKNDLECKLRDRESEIARLEAKLSDVVHERDALQEALTSGPLVTQLSTSLRTEAKTQNTLLQTQQALRQCEGEKASVEQDRDQYKSLCEGLGAYVSMYKDMYEQVVVERDVMIHYWNIMRHIVLATNIQVTALSCLIDAMGGQISSSTLGNSIGNFIMQNSQSSTMTTKDYVRNGQLPNGNNRIPDEHDSLFLTSRIQKAFLSLFRPSSTNSNGNTNSASNGGGTGSSGSGGSSGAAVGSSAHKGYSRQLHQLLQLMVVSVKWMGLIRDRYSKRDKDKEREGGERKLPRDTLGGSGLSASVGMGTDAGSSMSMGAGMAHHAISSLSLSSPSHAAATTATTAAAAGGSAGADGVGVSVNSGGVGIGMGRFDNNNHVYYMNDDNMTHIDDNNDNFSAQDDNFYLASPLSPSPCSRFPSASAGTAVSCSHVNTHAAAHLPAHTQASAYAYASTSSSSSLLSIAEREKEPFGNLSSRNRIIPESQPFSFPSPFSPSSQQPATYPPLPPSASPAFPSSSRYMPPLAPTLWRALCTHLHPSSEILQFPLSQTQHTHVQLQAQTPAHGHMQTHMQPQMHAQSHSRMHSGVFSTPTPAPPHPVLFAPLPNSMPLSLPFPLPSPSPLLPLPPPPPATSPQHPSSSPHINTPIHLTLNARNQENPISPLSQPDFPNLPHPNATISSAFSFPAPAPARVPSLPPLSPAALCCNPFLLLAALCMRARVLSSRDAYRGDLANAIVAGNRSYNGQTSGGSGGGIGLSGVSGLGGAPSLSSPSGSAGRRKSLLSPAAPPVATHPPAHITTHSAAHASAHDSHAPLLHNTRATPAHTPAPATLASPHLTTHMAPTPAFSNRSPSARRPRTCTRTADNPRPTTDSRNMSASRNVNNPRPANRPGSAAGIGGTESTRAVDAGFNVGYDEDTRYAVEAGYTDGSRGADGKGMVQVCPPDPAHAGQASAVPFPGNPYQYYERGHLGRAAGASPSPLAPGHAEGSRGESIGARATTNTGMGAGSRSTGADIGTAASTGMGTAVGSEPDTSAPSLAALSGQNASSRSSVGLLMDRFMAGLNNK